MSFSRLTAPRLNSVIIFHAVFLFTAMLANGVWSCSIWGNYYWSVDYVSDFSPFHPISRDVINYTWGEDTVGGLNGISLTQLNLIWLTFSGITWVTSIVLTSVLVRTKTKTKQLDR